MRKLFGAVVLSLTVLCLAMALAARVQAPGSAPKSVGRLDITVLDESGKPLPGAQVSLAGHRKTTGKDGSCQLEVLAGRYPVLIRKDGYKGRRLNLGVRPGETTTQQVRLQKLTPARPPRK